VVCANVELLFFVTKNNINVIVNMETDGCREEYDISPCYQYTRISTTEPPVIFFSDNPCKGVIMRLPPGSYNLKKGVHPIGPGGIDGMVVPPNMKVIAFDYPNFDTKHAMATYDGSRPSGGLWYDLSKQNEGIGKNDIDSMRIIRTKFWEDFLMGCCNNTDGNPTLCQQFWGSPGGRSSGCNGFMSKYCTAGRLTPNSPCRKWCLDNPGMCDAAVQLFCASDPSDPLCACLTSPLAAPACFDKKCLSTGYRTQAMQDQTRRCPSIIHCNQNVTLGQDAYNNIVNNLGMKQTCTQVGAGEMRSDQTEQPGSGAVGQTGRPGSGAVGQTGRPGSSGNVDLTGRPVGPGGVQNTTSIPSAISGPGGLIPMSSESSQGSGLSFSNPLVILGILFVVVLIAVIIALILGDDSDDDDDDDEFL
jgi:hypothetical protein